MLGYHASHEQFSPSALLRYLRMAESAGFQCGMCSDHYHPWSDAQGESGFAFSWLGAALEATSLPLGSVCAPGQRYHPAIVAQAAATLAEMYPDRYWIALGSGQNLNEHITGERWPPKEERNARLLECVEVIRALWAGETVTHRGRITVEDAHLYTRPETPPLIVCPAITEETAAWAATWADAMITVAHPREKLRQVIDAYREAGGSGPIFLQAQTSFAPTREEALRAAREQWGTNIFPSRVLADLRMPADFEATAAFVRDDDILENIRVSAEPEQHAEWLHQDREMGIDRVFIHQIHPDQERFLEVFGERVLPALR